MTLEELIKPIQATRFSAEYWGKQPLLVPGEARRFSALISSADLGRLLHYGRPRPPKDIMLVKGSRHSDVNWTEPDGTPRLEKVRAAWREGYTVVVNGLGRFWEPVALFGAALQSDLQHSVNINMYLTPPNSKAFEPHFDIMDTFILQVEGTKIWEVREAAFHLPLPDEHIALPQDRLPSVIFEEEFKPGSVLYIPRGFVHSAKTTGSASLHLTIGVNVVTWMDLLSAALSGARDEERLRQAVPLGFFNRVPEMRDQFGLLVDALPKLLNLDAGIGRLAEQVTNQTPPPGDETLAAEPELNSSSIVARRGGLICRTERGPGYAAIQYSGGKILGPEKIGPALQYAAETPVFSVGSMPGELNEREKLVLARRLIREGLLELRASRA